LYNIKRILNENKYLAIALGLYLSIFILGIFVSPWDNISNQSIQTVEAKKLGFNIVQIKFMLFGIYDMLIMFSYIFNKYKGFVALIPFFVTCALFTFSHILIEKISHYFNEENKIKKIISEYCFDNVLGFIVSFIVYYFFAPSFHLIEAGMSHTLLKILIWVLFALIFIIPSIPKLGEFIAYMLFFDLLFDILGKISASVENPILSNILIYAATLVLLLILILITKILLKILIDIAEGLFKGTLSTIIGFLMMAIFFAIGVAVLGVIITLIMHYMH
jgi:hypothetical protein